MLRPRSDTLNGENNQKQVKCDKNLALMLEFDRLYRHPSAQDDLECVLREGLLQRLFDIVPETGEYDPIEEIAVAQRQQR